MKPPCPNTWTHRSMIKSNLAEAVVPYGRDKYRHGTGLCALRAAGRLIPSGRGGEALRLCAFACIPDARAKGDDSKLSGPSRIKTYGNLSIMTSSEDEARDIFFGNIGLNLSFEGNTSRTLFIPFFGLETGGLYQRDFSTLHFSPIAGIQIFSSRNIIWNIQGGYLYTTKAFDEYSGYSVSSTINVLLWKK